MVALGVGQCDAQLEWRRLDPDSQRGGRLSRAGSTVTIGADLQIGAISFGAAAGSYILANSGGRTMDITGAGISSASAAAQKISSNSVLTFHAGASAGPATMTIDSNGDMTFTGSGATAGSAHLINSGQSEFSRRLLGGELGDLQSRHPHFYRHGLRRRSGDYQWYFGGHFRRVHPGADGIDGQLGGSRGWNPPQWRDQTWVCRS